VLFDRIRLGVPESEPIVSAATRDAVRAAMADAVCCGTATRSQLAGDVEQIGTSGSVQDMPNAWFTGSTPAVTTVVWVGGMEPTTERVDPPLTGNGTPAEIWADYTGAVAANDQSSFPR
jgi:membrane peptidoglycan carboxypeptidase